ncbi:MAG: hypothetical protein V7606_2696 [Burkholderiales bacterium]
MAATTASKAQKSPIDYDSETRFGVVMYGGVSLAMYINGVANEMYEMARATPKFEYDRKPIGTCALYRRLSWLVNNPDLREEYCRLIESERLEEQRCGKAPRDVWPGEWDDTFLAGLPGANRVRLVVDAIAGTSAGGINGIFLAKALANGEPFERLKDLWLKEGDISSLLNDRRSYNDIRNFKPIGPPGSLLNGDRMYLKLLEAIEGMSSKSAEVNAELDRSMVDELDLFVTTTDINGSPIPLRLTDDIIYELRHKRSFHFSYSKELKDENDFIPENNGLLAFAARCTSSFPFAFEPMTLAAAERLLKPRSFEKVKDAAFFSYLPNEHVKKGKHLKRAFGDGGYLDNKPFSYVANILAIRQAFVPVDRKLIYVEPAPQAIVSDVSRRDDSDRVSGSDPQSGDRIPDALSNSFAALTTIPRYETIREDLQAVLTRNHAIERVDRIVREGEKDLHQMLEGESNPYVRILREKQGRVPPFPDFERSDMVKYFGTAFLAYRRVRVSSVTDRIAERLGQLWDTERDSDQHYALTAIVREWRDLNYQEETKGKYQSINRFMEKFDVDYRIRRLSFLLRQIDHLTRVLRQLLRNTRNEPKFKLTEGDLENLPLADERMIMRLEEQGLCLLNGKQDACAMQSALAALKVLKADLNAAQKKWRIRDHVLGKSVGEGKCPIDDNLRKELKAILSLVLGHGAINRVTLTTRSGKVPVIMSRETQRACSYSRTMRESVLIRVRALNAQAKLSDRTILQNTLEAGIESMDARIDGPVTWDLLGKPRLTLVGTGPTVTLDSKSNPGVKLRPCVDMVGNPVLDSIEGQVVRRILGEYYVYFDLFDQMSFPLFHGTGIGEPCTVEVARISPKDARTLVDEQSDGRRKLAGTALGNFGGFLDERWRRNDIMWGRLDGAERLIKTMLPMSDSCTQTIREELTRRAHLEILRATFLPEAHGKLLNLWVRDLNEMLQNASPVKLVRERIKAAVGRPSQQRAQLLNDVASLLDEQGFVDYVKKHDVDRKPDPQATLNNVSRAVTITGRILQEITNKRGMNSVVPRWLARSGLMLQGMVAVSLPGSLSARVWSHTLKMLYMFLAFLFVFALLQGSSGAQGLAVTALIVTVSAQALTRLFGDMMESKAGMLRAWLIVPVVIGLALAAWGVIALYKDPWCETFGLESAPGSGCFWAVSEFAREEIWNPLRNFMHARFFN